MSGIVKVIVSFFRKGEEVAFERHRSRVPIDKEAHKEVSELKKHLTDFLGLKKQAHKYGIGGFSLKLFRLAKAPAGKCENFAIFAITYAQDFGTICKESLKRTSRWAAKYYTHDKSYYPVP